MLDIDELLYKLYNENGTDLHISVGTKIKIRVYGELRSLEEYGIITDKDAKTVAESLLDTLNLSILNTQGSVDISYQCHAKGKDLLRFRVNFFKQRGSISAVFRLLKSKIPEFADLNLPPQVHTLTSLRRGLVLVTGATGSGKTTTLATLLNTINANYKKHILTLEDPIEYTYWSEQGLVNQREIGVDCPTFNDGLVAALREDPDVILIGEMRDNTSTKTALQAAETGHLVCSTLHTLGAAETIDRIISMFPYEQHQFAISQICSTIQAIVAQQLLPKKDGDGYIVACEILFRTPKIIELIRENKIWEIDKYLISPQAKKEGMCSMDNSIINLYKKHLISKATAFDYAFNRNYVAESLKDC